jgi:hypothetical protein
MASEPKVDVEPARNGNHTYRNGKHNYRNGKHGCGNGKHARFPLA